MNNLKISRQIKYVIMTRKSDPYDAVTWVLI